MGLFQVIASDFDCYAFRGVAKVHRIDGICRLADQTYDTVSADPTPATVAPNTENSNKTSSDWASSFKLTHEQSFYDTDIRPGSDRICYLQQ